MSDPDEGPFSEIPGSPNQPSLPLSLTPFPTSSTSTSNDPTTISGIPPGTDSGSLSISATPPLPSSPTSVSSSTPSPSPTPSWVFEIVHDIQTCEPLTISWHPVSGLLTSFPPDSGTTLEFILKSQTDQSISVELAAGQPINDGFFVANNASVPPGSSYFILGRDSSTAVDLNSNNFNVINGPNTSCLTSGGAPTSSSSSTSAAPSQTGSSGNSSGGSSRSVKVAAIVGGTVGGVALLGLIILGTVWFIAFRRGRRHGAGSGMGRHAKGGWDGLGSREYKPSSSAQAGEARLPRRSGSTSASLLMHPDRLGSTGSSLSFLGYEASVLNPSQPSHVLPAAAAVRPSSVAGSRASHEMSRFAPSPSPLPQAPPTAAGPRRSSEASMATFSMATPTATDSYATVPSASASSTKRSARTVRKPVPMYEPTTEELAQIEMARSHSRTPSAASLRGPPFQVMINSNNSAASTGSFAMGGGGIPATLTPGPQAHAQAMLWNLKSKSSGHFAGGTDDSGMHYLIPDPPMPPRDY